MTPVHLRPIAEATWRELGRLAQSHIERRFLAAGAERLAPWGAASLERAAHSLAIATLSDPATVGIVTGFCVTSSDPPAAETDGPPGALMLAGVLAALATNVVLISDRCVTPLLRTGVAHCGIKDVDVVQCPLDAGDADQWCQSLLRDGLDPQLTHLVSIERAGPSHTVESIRQQTEDEAIVRRFAQTVPAADHDRRHNMRGEVIDRFTAPLDRLFEMIVSERRPAITIGIGDGGNEIGLGTLPWKLLSELGGSVDGTDTAADLPGGANLFARVACRVATDHTIVAGVSNWGGFALALAVAALRGLSTNEMAKMVDRQTDLVETLVNSAGAVDGFSGRPQPLVDGLDRDAHLAPLRQMHDLLFTER